MSEANKNLVRRYLDEVGSQGKLEVVDKIFASDFVNHFPAHAGEDAVGSDKVKTFVAGMRKRAPYRKLAVEDLIAEGDKVVARVTIRGSRIGEWQGIPADGKAYEMSEFMIFRVANGKLAERWMIADWWGEMKNLGAVPVIPTDWPILDGARGSCQPVRLEVYASRLPGDKDLDASRNTPRAEPQQPL